MEWKEVRLESILALPSRNGLNKPSKIRGKGVKMIGMGELFANPIIYDIPMDRVPVTDKELFNSRIMPGDLLFARQSLTLEGAGKCCYVKEVKEETVFESHLIRIRIDKTKADAEFIYYFFNSFIGKCLIQNLVTQVAAAGIRGSELVKLEITIPKELEDQRRIASILSSLDRKIELNNKINADLEEMAQAIFKNWFVDFEPFKDGEFVDSELGMIPEGWKVGLLGELCNFKRGKNLLTKNAIDEGVPVVAGGLEPSCYHNEANTGAPVITVSGSGANAGFMRMYHVPVWASDCSFIDISCENFYFVYCFLKVNSKLLKHAQTGAVQPHVKPSDIHDFELVIPDKESIYDFQDKVKPFFDKIASIQKENSRLSLLRDTLLPRLMSGELEVPE